MRNDMDDFKLNALLKQHFQTPPTDRLNRLEQDVWRRIRQAEAKPTLAMRLQDWVAPLWSPQLRYAPIAMAVVIGLSTGTISHDTRPQVSNAEMLSLNVFSAKYSQLPSNIMKVHL
jgi:hypothetical protein